MGRYDEAMAVCRRGLQLQHDFAEAEVYLRLLPLLNSDRLEEVVALLRVAVRLRPNQPEAHVMLSRALCGQYKWDEAATAVRRASEAKGGFFPVRVVGLFEREIETVRKLEPDLTEFVSGARVARDAPELYHVTALCWFKLRYRDSARVFAHAFAADPDLARDAALERRYMGARFAAMAAAALGDGKDLDDAERARLRKQALAWLRADLDAWRKVLESGSDDDKALARERLAWWQADPKLAIVRDADKLAKLPPDEQKAAKELWAGVAEALATAPK
jgi:serine/threonine-protein kinase